MLSPLFATRMDVALFALALAGFSLGAVALSLQLARPRYTSLPWNWLAAFSLLYGAAIGGQAVRVGLGEYTLAAGVNTTILVASFGALSEFARRGWNSLGLVRVPMAWTTGALILAPAGTAAMGLPLAVGARYLLLIPAGFWTAVVLWRAAALAPAWRLHVRAAAILAGLTALSFGLVSLQTVTPPDSSIDFGRFASLAGLPIQVWRAGLTASFALALWLGAEAVRHEAREKLGEPHRPFPLLALSVLLSVSLAAGLVIAEGAGRAAERAAKVEAVSSPEVGAAPGTAPATGLPAPALARRVARGRLLPLGFTGVILLLMMISGITYVRIRDSADQLRAAEHLYRSIVAGAPNALMLIGRDGLIIAANPRAAEVSLRPESELVGASFATLWAEGDRPDAERARVAALAGGIARFARSVVRGDGGRVPCEVVVVPIRSTVGAIHRVAAVISDISARKAAEQKIELLALALRSIRDAVTITDLENRLLYVNRAFEEMYDYPADDVLGRGVELIRSESRSPESELQVGVRTIEGGWQGEVINRRRDGTEFPVLLSTAPLRNEAGQPVALIGVAIDITDRVRQEASLREAKEAAEAARERLEVAVATAREMALRADQANRAKSEFLANMSHEIRTPMNGVIGMTGLLIDTDLTPEQRDYAGVIRSSAESLLAVVNDILDFSKIEAGKVELETIDFDLGVMVEETIDMLAVRAHEKDLELTCQLDHDVPLAVRGDPGRLRQVLVNLCGNAIKFTERGEVGLRVSLDASETPALRLRFTVRDTGIGIRADAIGRLFQSFSQVDASTTRRFGGTGLGLAIARRLVEQMGGTIGVESEEGVGSTFWFTASFEPQEAPVERPVFRIEELRGMRILVVDDNRTNRILLCEELTAWGCRPEAAAGGHEALVLLRTAGVERDPFRIAILDRHMPGMDGEQLGAAIKADPAIAATTLVMLSSWGVRGEARLLDTIGFAAFLTKPAKRADLYGALVTVARPFPRSGGPSPLVTRHWLAEQRTRKARVLVAEDNTTNQKVAVRMLEQLGYRADTVADGREAVTALGVVPYDIVLMDVQMPEVDGFEATRQIRERERGTGRHVPIVALTAHVQSSDRDRCLEAGMDAYVAKPLLPRTLADVIERLVPDATPAASAPSDVTLSPDAIFDEDGLVARLGGDRALAREVLAAFLEDVGDQIAGLAAAVEKGDAGLTTSRAHSIKGVTANIGGRRAEMTARALGLALGTGLTAEARRLASSLGDDLAALASTVTERLASPDPAQRA